MTTEAKEHKEGTCTPEQSIAAMQGEGKGGGGGGGGRGEGGGGRGKGETL